MCQHLKCVQQTRQVKCLEAHQHGLPLVIQSWWFNPYFNSSAWVPAPWMLLHMFSIVFMLLLLRPVTTCYDAMLMPYALCVASIRHQLSDRPKRPLRLRGSSAHSRAQWSTTKLHCNRIGTALESQLHV